MSIFQAICPECDRTINLEKTREDIYYCPFCGRSFSYAELHSSDNIVDIGRVKLQFERGQYAFKKEDYITAEEAFGRVVEIDRNNFIAEYFYQISALRAYVMEGKPIKVSSVVKICARCIKKMRRTPQSDEMKADFLRTMFEEIKNILSELLTSVESAFKPNEKTEKRDFYLTFAGDIKPLASYDREETLMGDEVVIEHWCGICDIAIKALAKAIEGIVISDNEIDLPSSWQYARARSLYNVFNNSLKRNNPVHRADYFHETCMKNVQFNESVKRMINAHNNGQKTRGKSLITLSSDELKQMIRNAKLAFDYTYCTIFNGLGNKIETSLLKSLLVDCMIFAEQIMMPRFYANSENLKEIDFLDYATSKEFFDRLNNITSELSRLDEQLTISMLDNLYAKLYEIVRVHYVVVQTRIRNNLAYLVENKNKAYFYYRKYLYGIVNIAVLASSEVISFLGHRLGDRLKLLKVGKTVAEDLLYMFSYRTEDMEAIPKFAKIPKIFNIINTTIKQMT